MRKKILLMGIVLVVFATSIIVFRLRRSGCSTFYSLNPDVTCRILDRKNDGIYLIEYFDADTNEFRLFVRQDRKDSEIEHPSGKARNFNDDLRQNQVKFSSGDNSTLSVNGEIFPITPKLSSSTNGH